MSPRCESWIKLGAWDAPGPGMGCVAIIPTEKGTIIPILLRNPFPTSLQTKLVSSNICNGTINNSNLELCGNIANHDIVAQSMDISERMITTLSGNIANVLWLWKGLTTTTTRPPAYLLQFQAYHQRFHRYLSFHDYIPIQPTIWLIFVHLLGILQIHNFCLF